MNTVSDHTDIRAFMGAVAQEFRALHSSRRTTAVLEAADAGHSFEYDLVRAKFRTRNRNEVNAGGVIVTVENEADVPENVTPAEVARLITTRLPNVDVVKSSGVVSRVEYIVVPLDELLRDGA